MAPCVQGLATIIIASHTPLKCKVINYTKYVFFQKGQQLILCFKFFQHSRQLNQSKEDIFKERMKIVHFYCIPSTVHFFVFTPTSGSYCYLNLVRKYPHTPAKIRVQPCHKFNFELRLIRNAAKYIYLNYRWTA